jgi:hypothetical protein
MKKIRTLLLSLIISPLLLAGPLTVVAASPVAADAVSDACSGIGLAGGSCKSDEGAKGINKLLTAVLQILTVVAGVAAVIMIILAGFRYITSGGDTAKVVAAKSSLVYAIVGLFVVALAQIIVHFVLAKAN